MTTFPHEERAKHRKLFKNLEGMTTKLLAIGEGREPMPAGLPEALYAMTGTSDLLGQHVAITAMLERQREAYMERLVSIARHDLTAFAEVINPDEPPAAHHIYLCDRLHDVMAGKLPNVGLSMPPGHAKDLDVETPVMMGDGSYKRLGDVRVGEDVITLKGRPREVLAVHDQGVRPVIKIVTESGRTIRPHPDHLFLTPRGWVKAGELTIADTLAIVREFEIPDTSERTLDEFIFAGYMCSFGFARDRTSSHLFSVGDRFRSSDPKICKDFRAVCDRLGFATKTTMEKRYNMRAETILICAKAVAWLQESKLLDFKRDTVRTPDWVFRGDERRIGAYLGAIFSTNSSFTTRVIKQTGAAAKVSVQLRNSGLVEDIHRLLVRLDVYSVRSSKRIANYNYRQRMMSRLSISDGHDQVRLAAFARFVGDMAKVWSRPIPTRGFASRAEYHDDPIVSITPDGERSTRCLTVEEDASFLANDVVVHNSTYASHLFPAFWMGNRPKSKFLQGSHTQSFVETDMSARVRAIMASEEYRLVFPEVALHDTKKGLRDWWLFNEKGRYKALGVNKASAGVRANCVNIDDPYPGIEEARSTLYRAKVYRWFTTDMRSRRLPGCPTILIHTRWHSADLIGLVKKLVEDKKLLEKWEFINIPLLSEGPEVDPLGRQINEILWPEFYTVEAMEAQRAPMDVREWQSLYQGKPTPDDGDVFKSSWIRYYKELPSNDATRERAEDRFPVRRTVVAVDTKKKESQRGDYSAIATLRETAVRDIYIAEVKRGRWLYPDLEREIDSAVARWGADVLLVEPEGMGLQYLNTRKTNPPCPMLEASHGNKSKEFRVDATIGLWQGGRVFLPEQAAWLGDFLVELLEFPASQYDDQLDGVTHGVTYLMKAGTRKLGTQRLGGR